MSLIQPCSSCPWEEAGVRRKGVSVPLHKSGRWMGSRVKPKPNGEPQTTHLCQLLLSQEKPALPCQMRIGSVQESSPLSQGLLGHLTQQGVDGRCWLKTMQQLRVPVEPTLAGCLVLRPLLSLGVSKKHWAGPPVTHWEKPNMSPTSKTFALHNSSSWPVPRISNDQESFLISVRKY